MVNPNPNSNPGSLRGSLRERGGVRYANPNPKSGLRLGLTPTLTLAP